MGRSAVRRDGLDNFFGVGLLQFEDGPTWRELAGVDPAGFADLTAIPRLVWGVDVWSSDV
jgi:hypothetical protein